MIDVALFFAHLSFWTKMQTGLEANTEDVLPIQMQRMLFSWEKETLFHFSSLVTFPQSAM